MHQVYETSNISKLLGRYFVGIWNNYTNTFDVDGIEKVEYKRDQSTISV